MNICRCQTLLIDEKKAEWYDLSVQEYNSNIKGGIKLEIGTQIKRYRTELNLSQEELAEKVFVTRQTISNWETGVSLR